MFTPDMRVCAVKGTNSISCELSSRPRRPYLSFASTTIERPSGVSSASDESCAASAISVSLTPGAGMNSRRLAIAERDGAGLVEQQRVDVAGGFDGASRHGQHVVLDQAIHAGDADGGQQAADGGRNQADQQRDQHEHRLRRAGVDGERLQA